MSFTNILEKIYYILQKSDYIYDFYEIIKLNI
jgi:hypothetical protein